MIQIGKSKEINGAMMYSVGYEDGLVYKDEDAFLHHPDRVCYIPEGEFENVSDECDINLEIDGEFYYTMKGYTRNQLAAMAEGTYDEDGDEITAEQLFYHCTWQYPETYLDEIIMISIDKEMVDTIIVDNLTERNVEVLRDTDYTFDEYGECYIEMRFSDGKAVATANPNIIMIYPRIANVLKREDMMEKIKLHCGRELGNQFDVALTFGVLAKADERETEIKSAGEWLDLDKCEMAYSIGGKKTTWMDYEYDWYKQLTNDDKCDCEDYWDDEKYYADFKEWWDSLPFAEQERIYNML